MLRINKKLIIIMISISAYCGQNIQDTILSTPELDGHIMYDYDDNTWETVNNEYNIFVGDNYLDWPSNTYTYRGYLSFNINGILPDSDNYSINSIILNVYMSIAVGNGEIDSFPQFYDIPSDSNLCLLDHIDYGTELSIDDWESGDLGNTNTIHSNIGIFVNSSESGWKSFDITQYAIEDYYSGNENTQYRLRFNIGYDDDHYQDVLSFFSSDDPINEMRPYIHITYTPITSTVIKNPTIPNEFNLYQNYPNPFNPTTTIKYNILTRNKVTIAIYDILGNKVTTLISKIQDPGDYDIRWDINDKTSGIYFYQLIVENFIQTRKMIVLK